MDDCVWVASKHMTAGLYNPACPAASYWEGASGPNRGRTASCQDGGSIALLVHGMAGMVHVKMSDKPYFVIKCDLLDLV